MSSHAIVTVASWEPRFLDSSKALIFENPLTPLYVVRSERYADWTEDACRELESYCSSNGSKFFETKFDFEAPGDLWSNVVKFGAQLFDDGVASVVLDGTTTPRELTWYFLHLFGENGIATEFVYVPAREYGSWLSKESLTPRLVLKRSGIVYPDKLTCVVAISGFDIGRLNQLVSYYEPVRVEIARQTGASYDNVDRNAPGLSEYTRHANIFEFDSFDLSGKSHQILKQHIEPLLEDYNVLLASLGPKLSSVIAFEITEQIPSVALVYIPSNSYSKEYSKGADLPGRVRKSIDFAPKAAALSVVT